MPDRSRTSSQQHAGRRARRRWSPPLAVLASLALLAGGLAQVAGPAPAAAADVALPSADALPTVQVDGVVWDTLVVGDRVYATGSFSRARPAGAAPGTNQTTRSNILAFDLTTGALVTTWNASLNGQGLALAASADGSRVFVAGDFTSVNGTSRARVAALDAGTGALVSGFRADANARVRALAVSGSTLYVGGIFSVVGGQSRTRLAAVSASSGAVQAWAPAADAEVMALVAPSGSGRVVAGGRFATLNASSARGMGALDASTGATLPWQANGTIQNYGPDSAVYSLSTSGDRVLGTAYDYYGPSEFEGSFSADVATGRLDWLTGCLGDHYDVAAAGGAVYTVSHAHDCSSIGANPETSPRSYQHAMATTTAATGTNAGGAFSGQPAPSVLLDWLPTLRTGTYTGQSQAAWTVSATGEYVVLGGEFPEVNGTRQQGLVRFRARPRAPLQEKPIGYSELTPSLRSAAPGTVSATSTAAWDRDDHDLTYELLRGERYSTTEVVARRTVGSARWDRPLLSLVDTAAPGGTTQTYRVRVTDRDGNTMVSQTSTVAVVAGTTTGRAYATAVLDDAPSTYWRLGEPSGTASTDLVGTDDLALPTSATRGVAGPLAGDAATTFSGSGVLQGVASRTQPGPQSFALETWVRTTTTRGGKLVGFGNSRTGGSTSYDRHVYMTDAGRLVFGVYPGTQRAVTSPSAYNDGAWHHVVANLGPRGMELYVDGELVASRADVTTAQSYSGSWRVGGDTISSSWPSRPTSTSLAGTLDEVAVYPAPLTVDAVRAHYAAAGGAVPNTAPSAAFTASAAGLQVAVDGSGSSDPDGSVASYAWDFGDGATGSGRTAEHAYAAAGSYVVRLVVTDDDGATASAQRTVEVTAPPVNAAPSAAFTASASGLQVAVDGSGSSDPDGSVASYAWDFGDGVTGSGRTAEHAYAVAGSYVVRLVVTDDDGTTASAQRTVEVTAPPPSAVAAADTFDRPDAPTLGTAETGGAWTRSGAGSSAAVAGGSARISVDPGRSATLDLPDVSVADVDLTQTVQLERATSGGGAYLAPLLRVTDAGEYRARLRLQADGSVLLALLTRVDGTDRFLTSQVVVPGLTASPGTALAVRVQATGTSPTTLRVKVWDAAGAEPSAWQQQVTDSTAQLQGPGSVGLWVYASGSSSAPVLLRYDDVRAERG
ncbi:PKD domain-containing protein [Pseudokineococcus sp. 5B2Z-1]|uniref:PKD domain-containing protein n=1 Tax=Pseudokineococcus sp. 5B2Z-1 TaxID=3132744 RepID=UPI0030AA4E19